MIPAWLSKRRAAEYLGVDRGTTLARLIAAGKIRTVLVDGRVRIPRAELERVAYEGTDTAPPVRARRSPAPAVTTDQAEAIRQLKRKGF